MLIGIDASRAVTNQRTGTEAYAYFLIRAFLPLAVAQGHHIRLYFNQPPPDDHFPPYPNVQYRLLPARRLWTHGRLAQELHRHPPDLFFTPAHVIPFTYRGAAIATVHDLGYHYFPETHTRFQVAYLKWSTRHNCRRSRFVLADSLATKADLQKFYGTPGDKIKLLYPGIDPELKRVTDEAEITAVLQKHNITPPYLLYLGTLQPRKNLERLIDAHRLSGVPHQLVLAGRIGWRAQGIVEKAEGRKKAEGRRMKDERGSHSVTSEKYPASAPQPPIPNPHLPGYIPEADKAALLSGATALLFPSLYEGFGFPVLEAQACQTAVLCANSSSLPEVAGDAALLVDPHDTQAMAQGIDQIANDAALQARLVANGRLNVQRFSWEASAQELLNLIHDDWK